MNRYLNRLLTIAILFRLVWATTRPKRDEKEGFLEGPRPSKSPRERLCKTPGFRLLTSET